MITHTLHHDNRSTITHTESFGSDAAEVSLSGSSSIKTDISDDYIRLGVELGAFRRVYDNFTSAETLKITFFLQENINDN